MSNEVRYLRDVSTAATPGPWRIEREELSRDSSDEEQDAAWPERIGPFEVSGHVDDLVDAGQVEADAALVALLGSVRAELLAVVEAVHVDLGDVGECVVCGHAAHENPPDFSVHHADDCPVAALTAAIARHREAT